MTDLNARTELACKLMALERVELQHIMDDLKPKKSVMVWQILQLASDAKVRELLEGFRDEDCADIADSAMGKVEA